MKQVLQNFRTGVLKVDEVPETIIKSGGILLSIHTDNGDQVTRAKELFKRAGAEDISYTGETKAA